MAKKKEDPVVTSETEETGKIAEIGEMNTESGVDEQNVTPQTPQKNDDKNARKAAQVAENYGVSKVWSTGDGAYWATTEVKKEQLPVNRGKIVEYDFSGEN